VEHLHFKSELTAAAYVAGGLDPQLEREFELHLMECPECVSEVETWRALKSHLPQRERAPRPQLAERDVAPAPSQGLPQPPAVPRSPARVRSAAQSQEPLPTAAARPTAGFAGRRLAFTLGAVAIAGVAGWFARSLQGPEADRIGFFSLPAVATRGVECTPARLAAGLEFVAVRVPGAVLDQQLVPVDSDGRDLAPESYTVRTQADGAWVVQFSAAALRDREVRFEARKRDGTGEPLGCIADAASL